MSTTEKGTILVVDDDEAVLRVACRILERVGYEVVSATGGEEAIGKFEEPDRAFDLLLTDVVMPGMSGRILAERLKEKDPELPVLFMSAYTEDDVILKGIRVADMNFLPKPFTIEGLADAVEDALSQK